MKNFPIAIVVVISAACSSPSPEVDPDYRAEIESWRASRLERLSSDNGWLTVVGLHWLQVGVNRFGSNPVNEVVLSADGVPALAGTLEAAEGFTVVARAGMESGLLLNGEPLVEAMLASDADGTPDMLGLGRLRMYLIQRGDRLALRVKDPQAVARREFRGIDHFQIDEAYRVTARLEPYDAPREIQVPTVVGTPTSMWTPGLLHFTLNGHELSLEPYLDSAEGPRYSLIFRDRTSGESTYGAGRFLSAGSVSSDGKTVLDFNLAYNPPCAFTPYATCPLPTPQNSLNVAVEAGEKYSAPHH
jgi:uncharacterized protein (DUF1684 family)